MPLGGRGCQVDDLFAELKPEIEALAAPLFGPAGQNQTKAVKVLVEHRRGLTVALYLPWRRKLLGGYVFGEVMAVSAQSEVRPWDDGVSA